MFYLIGKIKNNKKQGKKKDFVLFWRIIIIVVYKSAIEPEL